MVRPAYNLDQRLNERLKMMQGWARHLDQLKATTELSPMRRRPSPFAGADSCRVRGQC